MKTTEMKQRQRNLKLILKCSFELNYHTIKKNQALFNCFLIHISPNSPLLVAECYHTTEFAASSCDPQSPLLIRKKNSVTA